VEKKEKDPPKNEPGRVNCRQISWAAVTSERMVGSHPESNDLRTTIYLTFVEIRLFGINPGVGINPIFTFPPLCLRQLESFR